MKSMIKSTFLTFKHMGWPTPLPGKFPYLWDCSFSHWNRCFISWKHSPVCGVILRFVESFPGLWNNTFNEWNRSFDRWNHSSVCGIVLFMSGIILLPGAVILLFCGIVFLFSGTVLLFSGTVPRHVESFFR